MEESSAALSFFKSSLLVPRRSTAKSPGSLAKHRTSPQIDAASPTRRKPEKFGSACLHFLSILLILGMLYFLMYSLVTPSSASQPLGERLRGSQNSLSLHPLREDPFVRKQTSVENPHAATEPKVLLTTPELCTITTDVRGNLGPATVMLNDGTDWLKDRWQAASDMGGTAIRGTHWVQLDFSIPVVVRSARLDWETAYSDHYQLVARVEKAPGAAGDDPIWRPLFTAPSERIHVNKTGTSPGFTKVPMPLHVVHTFELGQPAVETTSVRLIILSSATGWGVSLWRIEIYGTHQDVA